MSHITESSAFLIVQDPSILNHGWDLVQITLYKDSR